MKYVLALVCAALLSQPSKTFASETPKPERKPVFATVSNALLPAPVTQVPAQAPPLEPIELPTEQGTHTPVPQPPQSQQAASLQDLTISRKGDIEMSCPDLYQEALNMRDIIYVMEDEKTSSSMKSNGVKAAGAVGSFLIGTVTGGVGLAVGGFLLDQGIESNKNEADQIQDIAEQRRTLMMGIFNAKECEGPIENAMQNPEKFDPIRVLAAMDIEEKQHYQSTLRRRYNR